jgi:hypothetical protein
VALFDRGMRYLGVSPAWRYRFGYALAGEDLIGNSHYDVIPDMPEHWRVAHQRGLAGEVVSSSQDSWVHEQRTVRLRWRVMPWRVRGRIGGISIYAETIDRDASQLRDLLTPRLLEFLLNTDPLTSRDRLDELINIVRVAIDEAHIARVMAQQGCSRTKAVEVVAEALGTQDRHMFRLLSQFPRLSGA